MPTEEMKQVFEEWEKNLQNTSIQTVVFCSTHFGADFDDYSALSAFVDYLQNNLAKFPAIKEINICLSGKLDSLYMELTPRPDKLWNDNQFREFEDYVSNLAKDRGTQIQLAVFGCSDMKRVSENPFLKSILNHFSTENRITSLNFDHHIGGENWANYNFVDDKASSNAENILDILTGSTAYKPNVKISTNLMVGLVSDTLNFFASSASYFTHSHAGKLMGYGCDIAKVREIMYSKWSVENLNRLNELVKKVEYLDLTSFTWSKTNHRNCLSIIDARSDSEIATLFKDECLDILKTQLIVLAKGKDNQTKFGLSIRCLPDSPVNASELATSLGGGGHRLAAGATIEITDFEQLKTLITSALQLNLTKS